MLGFSKVRNLATGLSIFKEANMSIKDKGMIKLYANSYFSGSLAMSLAHKIKYSNPEEVFVAGLLHSLPRLALANAYPEQYRQMDKLIRKKAYDKNRACEEVFDVDYDELCAAVMELYNISGRISEMIDKNRGKIDPVVQLISEASNMAGMLFGDITGGKDEIAKLEERVAENLNIKGFALKDFIQDSCRYDDNIERFFDLKEEDVEMMTNILEWGKATPAQVIDKLAIGNALTQSESDVDDTSRELLIGRFLTELNLAVRRGSGINDLIMLAQEALFRCLTNTDVFLSFLNKTGNGLLGRFYAGNNLIVKANDFVVDVTNSNSPIGNLMTAPKTLEWKKESGVDLKIATKTMKRLLVKRALMRAIFVNGKSIGLYFISRNTSDDFSEMEVVWFEEIASHVEAAFNKLSDEE
jgi:hypothetical protein